MVEFWHNGDGVGGRKKIDGKIYKLTETRDHSFASRDDYQWVAADGYRALLTDEEEAEVAQMQC